MNATDTFDDEAQRIAVASVRRHSMDSENWKFTVIGKLHNEISRLLSLNSGELVIASGFFSSDSWWCITTRRIVASIEGHLAELDPRYGIDSTFGNFKGIKRSEAPMAPTKEIATVMSKNDERTVKFEFETGKASMAPIYACMFWSRVTRFHYHES